MQNFHDDESTVSELIESIGEPIIVVDAAGRPVRWNEATEALVGLEQLSRINFLDRSEVLAGDGVSAISLEERPLVRALGGQIVSGAEIALRRSSSAAPSLVSVTARPLRDTAGAVVGAVAVFRDITARRRAEQALRDAEEQFRLTFDHAPIGMGIATLEGRWVQVNRALCEITGYSSSELTGLTYQAITHPDDLAVDLALAGQLLRGEIPRYQLAKRYIRRDGTTADVRIHGSLVRDDQGAPRHFIAQIEDMTARNQLELRLQVADRLASLGTFAAGVSHEVNNPLAYLMANLGLIEEQLRRLELATPSLNLGELHELVRDATDGADRVRKIVRGLKTFSRGDDPQLTPQDLRQVIELAIHISAGKIEPIARIVPDFGAAPRVDANEAQLAEAFIHLFVNSAQALHEGDAPNNVIGVRTSTEPSGNALVEIWDRGAGIARQHLTRIFDPFFTTRSVGQGTGMGLSICHGTITSFGGDITVESELGKGTRFRIVLPPTTTGGTFPSPPRPAHRG